MKSIIIVLLVQLVSITNCISCKCSDPASVTEAFNYTKAIIYGRVVKKEFVSFQKTMKREKANSLRNLLKNDKQKLEFFESDYIVKIELAVIKIYKGKIVNDRITIFTTRTDASCGFIGFEIGKEFIIYASSSSYAYRFFNSQIPKDGFEKRNTYWTNHCTRTKEYNANEAIELGKLMKK